MAIHVVANILSNVKDFLRQMDLYQHNIMYTTVKLMEEIRDMSIQFLPTHIFYEDQAQHYCYLMGQVRQIHYQITKHQLSFHTDRGSQTPMNSLTFLPLTLMYNLARSLIYDCALLQYGAPRLTF